MQPFGLTPAQYGSLALAVFGGLFMLYSRSRRRYPRVLLLPVVVSLGCGDALGAADGDKPFTSEQRRIDSSSIRERNSVHRGLRLGSSATNFAKAEKR